MALVSRHGRYDRTRQTTGMSEGMTENVNHGLHSERPPTHAREGMTVQLSGKVGVEARQGLRINRRSAGGSISSCKCIPWNTKRTPSPRAFQSPRRTACLRPGESRRRIHGHLLDLHQGGDHPARSPHPHRSSRPPTRSPAYGQKRRPWATKPPCSIRCATWFWRNCLSLAGLRKTGWPLLSIHCRFKTCLDMRNH
jgi:hypothetical protein